MTCPVIELAQQLIKRPSLSPNDEGCQQLMIDRLQAIGFTVEAMDFEDTQNFWAGAAKGKPRRLPGIPTWCRPAMRSVGITRRLNRRSATACCMAEVRQT